MTHREKGHVRSEGHLLRVGFRGPFADFGNRHIDWTWTFYCRQKATFGTGRPASGASFGVGNSIYIVEIIEFLLSLFRFPFDSYFVSY